MWWMSHRNEAEPGVSSLPPGSTEAGTAERRLPASLFLPVALHFEQIQEKWKPVFRPDSGGQARRFCSKTKLDRFADRSDRESDQAQRISFAIPKSASYHRQN
jgi:hypothetical protein